MELHALAFLVALAQDTKLQVDIWKNSNKNKQIKPLNLGAIIKQTTPKTQSHNSPPYLNTKAFENLVNYLMSTLKLQFLNFRFHLQTEQVPVHVLSLISLLQL